MRVLYDIVFLTFGVLCVPYLLIKRKAHRDFPQRLGFLPDSVVNIKRPVWIHAVSVGEAVLAVKLADKIKRDLPHIPVIVSTTTQTGNRVVRSKGKGIVDAVFYSPLDLRAVTARVVRLIDPALYIMVETELWPNLLEELHTRGVPVALINGRISDGSFRNYRKIRFVMRRILDNIDIFCVQSGKDAERIKELGASDDRVHVTGNMKFDEIPGAALSSSYSKRDLGFGENDKVIVAGSTHFSEEQDLIEVYKGLKRRYGDIRLILAPRHVERADAIEVYITKGGMSYYRFSALLSGTGGITPGGDVVLVDTIGHLKDIYGTATLVFVGGSLVRKGGQNPIEGARLGKAVVFGPHMYNFREIAETFVEGEAAIMVKNKDQLASVFSELLEDDGKRERLASNAGKIVKENSGAIDRTMEKIAPLLLKTGSKGAN